MPCFVLIYKYLIVKEQMLQNFLACGAEGDRTPDLLLAKQALSQLSYSPSKIYQGAHWTS